MRGAESMRRREFITVIGGAAATWPLAARAQQPAKPARIGVLGDEWSPPIEGLREGLEERGYVEGKNPHFEYRMAEGQNDRQAALAAELVALPVDVIATWGTPAALAAKRATTTIPIVMGAIGDFGLSEPQIANAIAMAAASDASFAVIRAKPLSQWKGLASAQSALAAMNTLFLARRGVEGPLQAIEGPNGIDNLLHMQIRIDWEKQGYEGVLESTIKKYNAMIHTQSAVHCMVELARQNKFDPGKVVSIEANVIRIAYDFAGGGHYGVDKVIRTKEQADHSLPYLLAVALLDGDVMPAQFAPDRITRADVQQLLKKVSVRPDQEFTDEYPGKMPAKITVRLQDGQVIEHELQDFPGLASHPFTWEDSVVKFDRLVAGRVDEGLSREIKDAAHPLESIQVADLMALLGRVKGIAAV